MEKKKGLPFFKKAIYGSGNLAANLMNCTVGSYISFYYTDVAGIPIAAAGLIMVLCKLVDAVTDLLMGVIVEKTNTKYGKARPWLLWMAIPFGISVFLMFYSPSWGVTGKIIFAAATYMAGISLVYTAISVPFNTLSVLITNTPEDRTDLATMRQFFGFVGPLIITSISMPIVNALGGGQSAWSVLAGAYGIIGTIIYLLVFFTTKEIDDVPVGAEKEKEKKVPISVGLKALFKNKYWLMVLAVSIFIFIRSGIASGILVYYSQYVLGNSNYYTPLAMATMLPTIVCCFFVPKLAEKYGKRNLSIVGLVISVIGTLFMLIGTENVTILVIGTIISSIGIAPISICVFAMIGDTVVYGEWKNGFRNDGLGFSAVTFAEKVGTAVGSGVASLALAVGGYVGGVAIQSGSAIFSMKLCLILAPVILCIALMIVLKYYKLDAEISKITEDLAAGKTEKDTQI